MTGEQKPTEAPQDRRTVLERMEARGWIFDVDPDSCTMTPVKVDRGGRVLFYAPCSQFSRDLEQCQGDAEAAGALVNG